MRVTNSMLVSNLMRNLNLNMRNSDRLQNMMASGRKFAHISDDPTALIYSQAARNKLARLSHYQRTVSTAQDWLVQAEAGVMELQGVVVSAYENAVDAAHDGKTASDKEAIGKVISQLRSHFVDTLNATFGDKYVYGGYNTPGDPQFDLVDRGSKAFTVEDGNLMYNGFNLSQFDGMPAMLLDSDLSNASDADITALAASLGFDLTAIDPPGPEGIRMLHQLKSDVLTFDVGPGISIPVTMNGIDLVLFTTHDEAGNPVVRSVYSVLSDLYTATTTDASASEITKIIKPLQDSQTHLLASTAEAGGRVRRLELLEARYEQDQINYRKMLSDAEDVDMAEVIMDLRMAEAVMQAAMSAGARIIQPTLMDFLR